METKRWTRIRVKVKCKQCMLCVEKPYYDWKSRGTVYRCVNMP